MEYNISKVQLHNDLLYKTLQALRNVLEELNIPLYVVGATARDIAMLLLGEEESKRRTRDLDVAIAISDWGKYDQVSEALLRNNFEKLIAKQRFVYKGNNGENDYEVDIIPFGGVSEEELIKWRPKGEPVMSVKCYEDVMNHAINITIENTFSIRIAPLCGQFLIKLDAWIDRHEREHKDAEDMLYMLKKYYNSKIMPSKDVDIPEEVDPEYDNSDDLIVSSARWVACDLRSILSTTHLQYYVDMITEQLDKESESELLQHFVIFMNSDKEDNFDVIRALWIDIRDIFQTEINNRSNEDRQL